MWQAFNCSFLWKVFCRLATRQVCSQYFDSSIKLHPIQCHVHVAYRISYGCNCISSLHYSPPPPPADFITPPGSGQFNFLLSGEVDGDGPPPGFVGCVQELSIDGDVVTLQEADQAEDILNGFCPSV